MFVQTFNSDIAKFVTILRAGGNIGLPTETVYGLAADATNGLAVANIFELKNRPKLNPLICHVADVEMAKAHGEFSSVAEILADAFWPGPLTLVVPLKSDSDIHPLVTAGLGTIGLRMPRGIARTVISEVGNPLAAPSANRSGRISPTEAQHVTSEFEGSDLLVLDNGPCEEGIESTILKVNGNSLILLRPGTITAEQIRATTGIEPTLYEGDDIAAPGMMKSHYAPDARLLLNQTEFPQDAAVLAFGNGGDVDAAHVFHLSQNGDLREAASNLYRGMKTLDATGVSTIYAQPIPVEGLGIAINDRLSRAAAPKDI